MTLDDIRALFPHLGYAVYAMDPGGPVTFEVYDDGHTYSFTGASEAAVLQEAFPTAPAAEPVVDIFG